MLSLLRLAALAGKLVKNAESQAPPKTTETESLC